MTWPKAVEHLHLLQRLRAALNCLLTLIKMAYSSPDAEWPKIWSVLAVPSLQLIPKF
jgi:hypothetical protein